MGFSGQGMIPIIKSMRQDLIYAEIGVCRGVNIKYMLDNCPNIRKIYGIDPWIEYVDGSGNPVITQEVQDKNYEHTKRLLNSYILDDNVHLIKQGSLKAVRVFEDNFFDMAYVDGDHRELAALADMRAWYPKVKPGGILAGHDYRKCDVEVRAAVKTFSEEVELEIHETKYWSWYVVKP